MLDPRVCLKSVIGLVPASCDCNTEGRPADFATSLSGLYILDRNYGLSFDRITGLKFPPGTTVWDFLEACRASSITHFFNDLARNIPAVNKNNTAKFTGFVGQVDEYSYAITGLGARVGFALCPMKYKGMVAKVRGFRLFVEGLEAGTLDVHLSTDLLKGITTPHRSFSWTGNTGKVIHVNVPTGEPLNIDLQDEYGQPVSIYFSYLREGVDPANIKFHCGTCGTLPLWWRLFQPKLVNMADTADAWWNIAQKSQTCSHNQYSNGLAVDLAVDCSDGWICSEWNYSADWPRVMADALMMYNQRETRLAILQTQTVNGKVIFGRDELLKDVELINTNLADRMRYLGANVPLNMSDCFVCDQRMVVTENLI